jgi:hypothetical protein
LPVLLGHDGTYLLQGRDGGGALQSLMNQTGPATQRTELLRNDDALPISGQPLQPAAVAAGQHQCPGIEAMFHVAACSPAHGLTVIALGLEGV